MFRFDRTNIRRQYNSLQIFNIFLTVLSMNYIFYRLNAVSIQYFLTIIFLYIINN